MQHAWDVLPERFLERIQQIIPAEKLSNALESFCNRHPSSFRANTVKISADELEKKLTALGMETERISWYPDAFILKNVPQKTLTETDLYNNGYLYVQNLSSMLPPLVLAPQAEENVLDIAAAPGSKTTQMASLMQNTGLILANDNSRTRLYKLEANLKMQGVTNTKVTNFAGQMLWKQFPEYFDKTLVDVPCSMEGRFYTQDPKSYKDWSPNKIKELVQRQRYLLRSAVSATKPGGIIVYSTCTLAPEENEEIINWLIKKEQGNVVIEDIVMPEVPFIDGLSQWKNTQFVPEITKTKRIVPSSTMEGFYIAKLRKLHPTT